MFTFAIGNDVITISKRKLKPKNNLQLKECDNLMKDKFSAQHLETSCTILLPLQITNIHYFGYGTLFIYLNPSEITA